MKNTDRIVGVLFIVIGIIFFVNTFSLPEDSQTYPRVLIGVMMLLALAVLIKSFITDDGNSWEKLFGHINWKRFILVAVVSLLYLFAINILGYFTATILYLLVLLLTLKANRKTILITVPIFMVGLYLLFRMFLKVPLPTGILI